MTFEELFGRWPGNESDEELARELAAMDELFSNVVCIEVPKGQNLADNQRESEQEPT